MRNRRFTKYPDDTDYTTNANSYYDDLARKQKLVELLAKRIWEYEETLDLTLEEIRNRLESYIDENDNLMRDRLEQWDLNLEKFPENVELLLQEWLSDGTLDHIINETIFNWKLDTSIFEQFKISVNQQFQQTEQSLNTQLAQIAYNISSFPRLTGETNDLNRFIRALAVMKDGDTLLFDGTMDFGSQAFSITKQIQLHGKNIGSSIIKNGLINIKASNVTCSDFFIDAINYADGFKVNDGECENIIIRNCKTNVKSHGYLFESYNGLVKNVLVENCIAENGLHGFINKAKDVTFLNCKAYDITNIAFGCITDNIQGLGKNAICEDSSVINCKAYRCGGGFTSYLRDKFNASSTLTCKNITVSNFFTEQCNQGMSFGDETIPNDYLFTGTIENVTLSNINITKSNFEFYGVLVNKLENANVSSLIMDSKIYYSPLTIKLKQVFDPNKEIKKVVNSANLSTGNVNLDLLSAKKYDILISSSSSNIISAKNYFDGDELTLMIRPTVDGTHVFGGFDTMFTSITGFNNTVPFGKILTMKWVYNRWTSKFICINYSLQ